MTEVVDLTQEIYQGMPVFPGHLKTLVWDHITYEETAKIMEKGYSYTAMGLLLCDHGPTHVDARAAHRSPVRMPRAWTQCPSKPFSDRPCASISPISPSTVSWAPR